ncbi:MAG: putative DNA binding domain-containing protein [Bacteroidales bacterium]|nr:putative DNA binding domain-containing protein [Bacteroidales bacterium]
MEVLELRKLVDHLVSLSKESETVEFKENFHSKEEIGERISALSNSACLHNLPYSYLLFGIENNTHQIIGTSFYSKQKMVGNEELEVWLLNRLNPRIDFQCFDFEYDTGINIALYKIPATENVPVKFLNVGYIRVNSSTRKLIDYPEKEKQIWKNELTDKFLLNIAIKNITLTDIPQYLSTETYFDLMHLPYPSNLQNVATRLSEESIISEYDGQYAITNLGTLLLAKNLQDFSSLSRKAVRVIKYKGNNKVETERDTISNKGYALGFTSLIDWVNGQLPANEEIGKSLRKDVRMYPEIAVRELIANCIIHQDFSVKGFPTIEIYDDRIEISNPGQPIIQSDRFIDEYGSRNERLTDIMRRMGFCEEKGSGLDKIISLVELYQLPPIKITVQENRTIVTIFAYKNLRKMDKTERQNACYQHACLKYVSNDKMTNQTFRDRLGIEEHNSAIVSRIIKDALDVHLIKEDDPGNQSRKYRKYIPWWA